MRASPHTRGWTVVDRLARRMIRGFPAHAGMDPRAAEYAGSRPGLPRTRGDGPEAGSDPTKAIMASPHTRGWTRPPVGLCVAPRGFPAHAGMDPSPRRRPRHGRGLPRTRGDGPQARSPAASSVRASPHTRGWTRRRPAVLEAHRGFPAHAGMDPRGGADPDPRRGLPRTRGDGPRWTRIRRWHRSASPHTRGWTRGHRGGAAPRPGFPAHAGMDPQPAPPSETTRRLPRTRGDGPGDTFLRLQRGRASPHTRGWTRAGVAGHVRGHGFPAHAGMDPLCDTCGRVLPRLPRTRGDGPGRPIPPAGVVRASPHTRGWTPGRPSMRTSPAGFPAHAGMDPADAAPPHR